MNVVLITALLIAFTLYATGFMMNQDELVFPQYEHVTPLSAGVVARVEPVVLQMPAASPTRKPTRHECRVARLDPLVCMPSFVIIGMENTLARELAEMLQQSDEVRVAHGCFFSNDEEWRRGAGAYWQRFTFTGDVVIGEMCDQYASHFGSRVVGRLDAVLSGATLIAVLPDPVEQFERHAAQRHMSPLELWESEGETEIQLMQECVRTPSMDRTCLMRLQLEGRGIVMQGFHALLLGQYRRAVLVVQEKDLYTNAQGELDRLFRALGVKPVQVVPPQRKQYPQLPERERNKLYSFYKNVTINTT